MGSSSEHSEYLGTWMTTWADPPEFTPLPTFESKIHLEELSVDDDEEENVDGYDGGDEEPAEEIVSYL